MEIAESTLQNKQATNIRYSTFGKENHKTNIRYLIKRILLHQYLSKELKEYSDKITNFINNTGGKPEFVLKEPPNWNATTDNFLKIVLDAHFGYYPTPWRTQEHHANQQNQQNTSTQQQYNPQNDMNIYILVDNTSEHKPVTDANGNYSVYSNHPNFTYSVMEQNINTLPPNDSMRIVKSIPILVILAPNLTSDKHKLINITVAPDGIKLITPTHQENTVEASKPTSGTKSISEEEIARRRAQKIKDLKTENRRLRKEQSSTSSNKEDERPLRSTRDNYSSEYQQQSDRNRGNSPREERFSKKQNPLNELEGLISKIQSDRTKTITRDHLIGLLEILKNIIGNK